MRIALLLVLALTVSGCCCVASAPGDTPIRDVVLEVAGTSGTAEQPAACDMEYIQVKVTYELARWPEGATGIEVVLVEVDSNTLPPGEPVPAMPEPIVLARHDITRVALMEIFKNAGSEFGISASAVSAMLRSSPMELTVSSLLWCNEPCTNGVCTLHGYQGKDSTEGDNTFELDAQVRIYGVRDGQRVILSESWSAKTRVDVHCKACPP